ncbi:hypothetical protein HOF92_01065 [bacterium]|jgi:hypothetical protein|nr:hypothetical protein [bacterium]
MKFLPIVNTPMAILKLFIYGGLFSMFVGASSTRDLSGVFRFNGRRAPHVGLAFLPQTKKKIEARNPVIDQIDKQFTKPISLASPGAKIRFKNSDSVNHNIYANDKKSGVNIDIGMKAPGEEAEIPVDWDSGRVIKLGCKIHPKMRTYVANINSDYYALFKMDPAQKEVSFQIKNIPEDLDRFIFWLPRYDEIEISLPRKGRITREVTRKGKVRGELEINMNSWQIMEPEEVLKLYRKEFIKVSDTEFSKMHWERHVRIYMNQGVEVFSHNYHTFLCLQDDDCEDEKEEQEFQQFTPGTIIVKEHFLPTTKVDESTPISVAMMKKLKKGTDPDGGDWQYFWRTHDGEKTIVKGTGKDLSVKNICAGCHSEVADRDYIFSTIGNRFLLKHFQGEE